MVEPTVNEAKIVNWTPKNNFENVSMEDVLENIRILLNYIKRRSRIRGMKNALILHGTDGAPDHQWFLWLQGKLTEKGWKVWVPQLPGAELPDIGRYNEFLLTSDWEFNAESVIIGHSSGAVEILGLLEALPENMVIDTAILVGAFTGDLGREQLKGMAKDFDFEKIKSRAKRFVLIHSDNDPYCPLEHAEFLADKLGGELIVQPDQAHFSIGTAVEHYREFPFLLELIESKK